MPVSNVAKAEVMYNAPAKYRVRGAVINLVLKNTKSEEPFVRGEVGTEYMQARYANGSGHANLSLWERNYRLIFFILPIIRKGLLIMILYLIIRSEI